MPRFSVVTFGCQMNQHDSDRIMEVLCRAGHLPVQSAPDADIIILNTCSVREKAVHKLRSEVGRLNLLKKRRPDLVIGVAGCVAQQEGDGLLERMPGLDFIVGPDNIRQIPRLLSDVALAKAPQAIAEFDLRQPSFLPAEPGVFGKKATAFVTVMKGCNERCSFCIVPHTRGPERYRPAREIIAEIQRWVDSGVSEVTLLGQTVNSYRDPEGLLPTLSAESEKDFEHVRFVVEKADETEFPALLFEIEKEVPRLERLRYTSPHPRHLTPGLIWAHRELEVLCRHVHMPVQSGSDRVLRRMIRRYTVAEYVERTDRLRQAVPGLTLSTDVIVGFPGETEGDFERTLALVKRLGFTGLFGFKYSPRPHTPALKLADDVPEAEKAERLQRLFEVSDALRQSHLRSRVGQVERVLVERGENGRSSGRSERNEIVHFASSRDLVGNLVPVLIRTAFKNSLMGELVDDDLSDGINRAPSAGGKRRHLPVVLPPGK